MRETVDNLQYSNAPLLLLVDDVKENLKVLGDLLRDQGFRLSIAANADQMFGITANRPPDLILLDVQMPEMDGFTACRKLKQCDTTRHIPVIFLTALNQVEDIVKGFESGGVDFISKPFNQQELLARVNTHLELKFARERIEHLSWYDELTGIPNKRYFNRHFHLEFKRAVRERSELSLLMVDIDHFKKVNDNLGHLEGDRRIQLVAGTIDTSLERPGDFVARFGGEEFACVLPETDSVGATHIGRTILHNIAELDLRVTTPDGTIYHNAVSIGGHTIRPDRNSDLNTFITEADTALYRAKELGRNRMELHHRG